MSRPISVSTQVIHALLAENKGDITFSQAQDRLVKAGVGVEASVFNVVKSQWKKKLGLAKSKRGRPAGKVAQPANGEAEPVESVSVAEAVEFVQSCGGFASAKAQVQRQIDLVRKFKESVAVLV